MVSIIICVHGAALSGRRKTNIAFRHTGIMSGLFIAAIIAGFLARLAFGKGAL
jgi:hypothetical protein